MLKLLTLAACPVLAACWTVPAPLAATPPARAICPVPDMAEVLGEANRRMVSDPLIAGVSSALIHSDGLVISAAAGWADVENEVRLAPSHRIPIGSISKLLTAAALGRLARNGGLSFNEAINDLVPDIPAEAPTITFAQLASHTAGIRHYVQSDKFLGPQTSSREAHLFHYDTVDEVLPIFVEDDLLFEPGHGYSYSSYGYTLLSAAMEKRAGIPFLDLMRREVIDPLGLRDTIENDRRTVLPTRARGYAVDEGKLINAPAHDPSYVWAGGGYLSTPADLVRFAQAHRDPGFIGPATVDLMLTRQLLAKGERAPNGIGWELDLKGLRDGYAGDPLARRYAEDFEALLDRLPPIAFHSGSTAGGHGFLAFVPETGVAVAYLSNSNSPEIDGAAIRMTYDMLAALETLDKAARACPATRTSE
jgi:serine beta-lactamase-like protein LACTB